MKRVIEYLDMLLEGHAERLKTEAAGSVLNTTTKAERKFKDGSSFPAKVKVAVEFTGGERSAKATVDGVTKVISLSNAYKWIRGFRKPPSERELEEWVSDGVAETVTGERTEPDGYGPDGSPSWLLVMGMI